jgi:LysM repeat protein
MRSCLRNKVGIVLISVLILQLVGLTAATAAPAAWAPYPIAQSGMPAPQLHLVRPGDTLFAIGRLYGVNPWAIARINRLPNPNIIFIGQVLLIGGMGPGPMPGQYPYPTGYGPGPGGYGPVGYGPAGYEPLVHRVRFGETLFSIARLYQVNPWMIGRANGLFNPNLIFAGQVLCIPGPGPAVRM